MKYLALIATLGLHFLAVLTLKLLDNPSTIIIILISSLTIGLVLKSRKGNQKIDNAYKVGWGMFYGSVTSLAIVAGLFAFLS